MKTKQTGIVLLTTILLTGLLALLILSQMQLFLLDFKALELAKEKQAAFFALERAAKSLLKNNEQLLKGSCVLNEHDPDKVIALLNVQKACALTYENHSFYYLIADLGVFPCLQIKLNKQNYSTRHFLLSIQPAGIGAAILQERHSSLTQLIPCENAVPKQAKTGLLSWRLVSL